MRSLISAVFVNKIYYAPIAVNILFIMNDVNQLTSLGKKINKK